MIGQLPVTEDYILEGFCLGSAEFSVELVRNILMAFNFMLKRQIYHTPV